MRLRLVLPPAWIGLPLHDPDACEGAVARAVRSLPLDDGQGARMRRELRDDLLRQVSRARDGGATYLALSGPRSAPLSGSILVTPLPRPVDPGSAAWEEAVGSGAETLRLTVGEVWRTARLREPDPDRRDDLPTLAVDYWVAPAVARQLHVACSTPLVAHEEAMVQLFDAVLESAVLDGD